MCCFEPAPIAASMAICRPEASAGASLATAARAEDGADATLLFREECWRSRQGKKVAGPPLRVRRSSEAVLRPDQAIEEDAGSGRPTAQVQGWTRRPHPYLKDPAPFAANSTVSRPGLARMSRSSAPAGTLPTIEAFEALSARPDNIAQDAPASIPHASVPAIRRPASANVR